MTCPHHTAEGAKQGSDCRHLSLLPSLGQPTPPLLLCSQSPWTKSGDSYHHLLLLYEQQETESLPNRGSSWEGRHKPGGLPRGPSLVPGPGRGPTPVPSSGTDANVQDWGTQFPPTHQPAAVTPSSSSRLACPVGDSAPGAG